ncbi:MAG: YjgN family protein [Burkholderiales bacterium]|nr:YjgN family protein [Burkholderiales bacterium]
MSPPDMPEATGTRVPFEFSGRAGEYFRIWIVNVFLTVITLGIYSAWAKVRRLRYLYGSTTLQGAAFEYLAEPVAILKGRLLAVGFFALYSVAGQVNPILQTPLALIFLVFLPWIVIRARKFALRNTAYRNIRLDFDARKREAAAVYIGWPILIPFSMMLIYPFYVWRRAQFLAARSRYGAQGFAFDARPGAYYLVYLKFTALFFVVVAAGTAGFVYGLSASEGGTRPALVLLALLATLFALLATFSYKHVRVANLTWSSLELGGLRTCCDLAAGRMYWIALSNLFAIVLSAGLLIPWATIRMMRYRVSCLSLAGAENLDALVGAQSAQIGAAGEEIGELLGIDIGL